MEAARFARTKIQPPRPRAGSLVARPALEARLTEALLTHRLVLLCAAAGYGKTTAFTREFACLPPGTALAWVAADEGDDLHRLFECLVAALEPFDPPWRTAPEMLAAGVADPAARRTIANELINTLDACDVPHGVIVLDDLHRVDDPAWFEFLDLVLDRLSPRWTVAIGARHEPPLALARLRASGELAEFRQGDLEFGDADVHALLAAHGLPDELAGALLERTQGWAVGLRLALNAQRGNAGAAKSIDRHVFEFLAAEVLDRLEPELREFLLRTSVLPELTATRCAAVSRNPRSAGLLEEIERLGLFASVLDRSDSAQPLTLRLHDLFRDALQHRLEREQAGEVPALLRRAAEGETDAVRRITLLRRAGDMDAAARVLLDVTPTMLTEGALPSVARLLDEFPRDAALASPQLQLVRGLIAWARWDFQTMLDTMRRAEAGFRGAGDAERARLTAAYQSIALNALGQTTESGVRLTVLRREAMDVETRVVVLVACLWHALDLGSLHRIGPLLDELVDTLEPSTDLSLWYRAHPIPRLNGLPGTARALDRYVDRVLVLTAGRPSPLRAMALAQRAWREAWAGRLDAAAQTLALVADEAHWLGDPPNVVGSLQVLAPMLHALRGERDAALAAARRCVSGHSSTRGRWSLWGNVFYAARIAAAFDDLPALGDHLAQLRSMADVPLHAAMMLPLAAQEAWLEGRADDAVRLWQQALSEEDRIDRLGHSVECRLRLAAACASLGRLDAAAAAVAPAIGRVAQFSGLGGVLLARSVLPALANAEWGSRLAQDDQRTLRGWHALAGAGAAAPTPAPLRTAEGLTARELEVLERIAAGDSNKLIARAFDLSPHTVKRHVANILDKLGASTRGQAAAWWRDHARAA